MKVCQCPLCQATAKVFYAEQYYHCNTCDLIFLHSDFHLSAADEKAVYDMHENSPNDVSYRKFLGQMIDPLLVSQKAPARALDFGCGPGPTVSVMLAEAGWQVAIYDPIYFPDRALLDKTYNVITATEVFEHLYEPAKELASLLTSLEDAGYLGLMTALHAGKKKFMDWGYKQDPTHVTFYSEKTMYWIAEKYNLEIVYLTNRTIIFKKS